MPRACDRDKGAMYARIQNSMFQTTQRGFKFTLSFPGNEEAFLWTHPTTPVLRAT